MKEENKNPIAVIETEKGLIGIELYPEAAPNTVRSFIWMAEQGLYDNRLIRRIVPGFVIQPSYSNFEDERCAISLEGEYALNGFDNPVAFKKGTVAMGGNGTVASGSCFFITLSDEAGEKLAGKFAAFGKVITGWDEVERLAAVETKAVDLGVPGVTINEPAEPERMVRVTVETWGETYGAPEILAEDEEE